MTPSPTVRRELRPGDLGRIVAHHGAVYLPEYGLDSTFEAHVGASVAAAGKRGFPREREGIWIVEVDGRHAGSVALTDEGDGLAAAALGRARPGAPRPGTRPPADRRGARRGRGVRLRGDRPRDVQRATRRGPSLPLAGVRGAVGGDRRRGGGASGSPTSATSSTSRSEPSPRARRARARASGPSPSTRRTLGRASRCGRSGPPGPACSSSRSRRDNSRSETPGTAIVSSAK